MPTQEEYDTLLSEKNALEAQLTAANLALVNMTADRDNEKATKEAAQAAEAAKEAERLAAANDKAALNLQYNEMCETVIPEVQLAPGQSWRDRHTTNVTDADAKMNRDLEAELTIANRKLAKLSAEEEALQRAIADGASKDDLKKLTGKG